MLGSESDSSDEGEFKINESYASKYETWRRKEELQKLKAKFGSDSAEESSSSSSSDTEDEEELTKQFDKDFLTTLSCLKKKDPKIYDKNVTFVKNSKITEDSKPKKNSEKKKKPIYPKDYDRHVIENKIGDSADEDDEDENLKLKMQELKPSLDEELKEIKQSFVTAYADSDNEVEDGLFKLREQSKNEEDIEEPEFWEWLKGNKKDTKDKVAKQEMKYLHDVWNDPNLDQGEKFLKDFMLNKRYLDKNIDNKIPSYNEVIRDSEELEEDQATLDIQDNFETKYNFRFEEPDPEFIKHYPRTLTNTLRRQDDKRKIKRAEIRQRKLQEKEKKAEELKQLKALKRKEIMEKLERLQEIAGCSDDKSGEFFNDKDLEGDFDPEEHERKMRAIFNDDFYEAGTDELQKPVFEDDDVEPDENWDKWTRNNEEKEQGYEPHCEDPDFNMDADYDPKSKFKQELLDTSQSQKKRRKSRFAQSLERNKRLFDPSLDKTFENYIDEYYKLDYEDIIGGDLPCRFKYRKVVPNDFGLTLEEIFEADDRELNKWCSLKKATQYRRQEDEMYDVQAFKKKASKLEYKKQVLASIYMRENDSDEKEAGNSRKQRRRKKKSDNQDNQNNEVPVNESLEVVHEKEDTRKSISNNQEHKPSEEGKRSRKRKRKNKAGHVNPTDSATNDVERNILDTKKKIKVDDPNDSSISNTNIQKPTGQKNTGKNKNTDNKFAAKASHSQTNFSVSKKVNVKRNKTNSKQNTEPDGLSDDRLRAYGFNPKKYKNKLKYGKGK